MDEIQRAHDGKVERKKRPCDRRSAAKKLKRKEYEKELDAAACRTGEAARMGVGKTSQGLCCV